MQVDLVSQSTHQKGATCARCSVFFEDVVGNFGFSSTTGKRRSYCKPCWNQYYRELRARPKTPKKELSADEKEILADERRENNRKRSMERYRRLMSDPLSRSQMTAARRVYRQANPEKFRSYCIKRRALLYGQSEHYSPEEWQNLCEHYNHICLGCGSRKKLTVDHVVPITKGGSNTIDNIQPLCGPCNLSKGQKTTDYRY